MDDAIRRQPTYISLGGSRGEQLLPSQLEHGYVVCASSEQKLAALRRLLKKIRRAGTTASASAPQRQPPPPKVLVFAEHHRPLEEMARVLARDCGGVYWNEATAAKQSPSLSSCEAIVTVLRYEDSLSERATAMDAFRGEPSRRTTTTSVPGKTTSPLSSLLDDDAVCPRRMMRVLLSTDLAARGLDVSDITHVIHFDLPANADAYVHRSGRTGRLGRGGRVVSIITPEQEFVLQRLANKLQLLDMACVGRQPKQKQ